MRRVSFAWNVDPVVAFTNPTTGNAGYDVAGVALIAGEAWDAAAAEVVHEQSVVVADEFRVAAAEVYHLVHELVFFATDGRDNLVLRLEAYESRVGVLIREAMDLGCRPAKVVEDGGDLSGLSQVGPVYVLDVG